MTPTVCLLATRFNGNGGIAVDCRKLGVTKIWLKKKARFGNSALAHQNEAKREWGNLD